MRRTNKRFAAMILMFDCEQFILHTIENCGDFVDKIYLIYSEEPWAEYNKNARKTYKNKTSKEILNDSIYVDKIDLIEGVWDREDEAREVCRLKAKFDGFDYLIVQDADEFYLEDDYKKNINGIIENPDFEIYQTPWITFWKNIKYVTQYKEHLGKKNTIFSTCPLFAINLNLDLKFEERRLPLKLDNIYQLTGVCFHLSYLLTTEEVKTKIETWSHANQVKPGWFKYKWLNWTPETKNIFPLNPLIWSRAVKYEGRLPKELYDIKSSQINIPKLSFTDKIGNLGFDCFYFLEYTLAIFVRKIKRKLKSLKK